ncbi:MAG: WYL domain-containing protein [Propionibacteriaceae bacterium]|jgi:predicted DNA-binding transcriptional regulator YafY|nr:WYL domain-containing protein [Propionibacteriaceae bacterium]
MDPTTPTARALLALELIQTQPGVTAGALAASLGVTERAARRYVGILREAEIPVLSVRGVNGGYTVGRGVRLPPLVFSSTEALGMVMAVLDGHHDAADTTDPVGSALRKIMRALPESIAAQAELVRRTARPVPDRYAAHPNPAATAALVLACSNRHQVRVGYRNPETGSEWETTVEPWAVVVRHGRWYLLCRLVASGGIRTYRLDRVTTVTELDESFEPPADLDPVAALEANFAVGWEFPTEVLVDAPLDRVEPCIPRTIGRLEAVDADHTRLLGSTSDPAWYAELLAALPGPFHVVSGPELRAAVAALGERLMAAATPAQGADTAT